MLETFKRLWLWWQGVAKGILWAQNALIMSVAYFAGLGPVAVGFRLVGRRPLADRGAPPVGASSYWAPRSGKAQTMDEAVRQF